MAKGGAKKPAAKKAEQVAGYELVHDAFLYVDGDETIDSEVSRGHVFAEGDLPASAIKRGLETGALVPLGKSADVPPSEGATDAAEATNEPVLAEATAPSEEPSSIDEPAV